MRYRIFFFLCSIIATQYTYAQTSKDWGYRDNIAPQYWANLNPRYLGCAEGNQQSPINIVTKNVRKGAMQFDMKYHVAKGVNLVLTNHAYTIIYPQGNFLEMGGTRYQLKEIHLKTPGENAIDSARGILEAQLLHEDSKGNMLIVAIMFIEGRANPMLDTLIKNLPKTPDKAHFISNVDVQKLLPTNRASYQFDGSLTTPPCSQNVRWILFKQQMTTTQSQVDSLRAVTKANARPMQDPFNRLIVED